MPIAPEPFEITCNPPEGQVFIGAFNGCVLICAQEIAYESMQYDVAPTEQILSEIYPDTEIASFWLLSGTNSWGYSIVKNGQKIRLRAGNVQELDGLEMESGTPLPEEEELFAHSILTEGGSRRYKLDGDTDYEYEEEQVGENFVFEVAGRYLGCRFDGCDELLFETELRGYSYERESDSELHSKTKPTSQRSWWKFW